MSNLIDRQAAIKVASKECYEFRGIFGRIENSLNKLPTVEAIPVVWIEKWLEAQERILRISPPYYHQITVRKLLEDWEKENE